MTVPAMLVSDAHIDGGYRYSLTRIWDADKPLLAVTMLNPSTAGPTENDPTIRKCIGFAMRWGYGGIVVVNLFAFRATKPKELYAAWQNHQDIVGPGNSAAIMGAYAGASGILVAWGACSSRRPTGACIEQVLDLAKRAQPALYCIGETKDGDPLHPLMAAYTDAPQVLWRR
jgi:hypothetical protein